MLITTGILLAKYLHPALRKKRQAGGNNIFRLWRMYKN